MQTLLSASAASLFAIAGSVGILPFKLFLFGSPRLPSPGFTLAQFTLVAVFFLWVPLTAISFVAIKSVRRRTVTNTRSGMIKIGLYIGAVVLPGTWSVVFGAPPIELVFWFASGAGLGALSGRIAAACLAS